MVNGLRRVSLLIMFHAISGRMLCFSVVVSGKDREAFSCGRGREPKVPLLEMAGRCQALRAFQQRVKLGTVILLFHESKAYSLHARGRSLVLRSFISSPERLL
jgi:hypothetical protein